MSQYSVAEAPAISQQDGGTQSSGRQDVAPGAVTTEEVCRMEKAMSHLRCIWVEQMLLPL